MTAILLAATLQGAAWVITPEAPTVGDTVWLNRELAAGAGAHARVEPLEPGDWIQPLVDPSATLRQGTLTVRYAVALFRPGEVPIAMPPIEVQYPDGRAVVMPSDTVLVGVTAVLPQVDPPPDPKPSLGPVARPLTRWWPLALLIGVTILGLAAWMVLRRRRGPRPQWRVEPSEPVPAANERWVEAGEVRAVAAAVADALRVRIAEALPSAARHLSVEECLQIIGRERPEWPGQDLSDVLRSLERARFAPAVADDISELGRRAAALAGQLRTGNGNRES